MQKITLIGNACADPELLETKDGIAYCRFNLAVNRKNGDKQETTFFRITAWRGQADVIAKYLKKGNKIYIGGDFTPREYETNNGEKKTSLEVQVQDFEFLTPKDKDEDKPKQESKPKPRLEPYDDFGEDSPF